MIRVVFKRLLCAVPVLLGVSALSFFILQLAPGDYFNALQMNPQIDAQTLDRMREQFGYHQPAAIRYLLWLKGVLTLDLGVSAAYRTPVSTLVLSRMGATLLLAVSSILLTWLLSIPLGVLCALRHRSWIDRALSWFMFGSLSLPPFFLALLLVYLSYFIPGLPSGGFTSVDYEALTPAGRVFDVLRHLLLPLTVVVVSSVGPLVRIVKTSVRELLASPFIVTARAKGVSERAVIWHHLMKNALTPLITLLGYQLSGLLSGVALTETILSWPGLGSLVLEAVLQQDTQVIMASLFLGSVMLVLGNLAADLLIAWVDPRAKAA